MKVYLASGSPRRRELLTQIGIEYEVKVSDIDEKSDILEAPMLVEDLSRRKAMAVFEQLLSGYKVTSDYAERTDKLKSDDSNAFPDGLVVIGADTVVALDGEILGKPASKADAKDMLRRLSGKTHDVYTGVTLCILDKTGGNVVKIFHEKTEVTFYEMSDADIDEYVKTGDPLDKAGAYGIQGFAARYIKGISGDYNNVVGLPIGKMFQELKSFL